ncbi:hypothetical protein N7493_007182 [Penicillium malachiteum]|uniref:Avirulence Effector AvrLm4-7 domain-containing protein n=1 Tax=Penicillium malachiteum TaxID=1324776 RepID=A0AAD6MUT1_9EURO|nr:hypothetical protein N7493_007182 [Penicillium malachiteum]
MKFLPTTIYLLTFQALVVVALPQDDLGPQAKCGRALKLLSEEDPAALEVLDIPESQVELDKESHERIYQGYCSAGTTQRCNFCDEHGNLQWGRCARQHSLVGS